MEQPTIKRAEGSTLRADIEAALRTELGKQREISFGQEPGSAPRLNVEARCNLLEEYIGLLSNEDMCVILEVKPEYPQNGRIRL
jgi:hypothetical protein